MMTLDGHAKLVFQCLSELQSSKWVNIGKDGDKKNIPTIVTIYLRD